jgi:hypothetical protein
VNLLSSSEDEGPSTDEVIEIDQSPVRSAKRPRPPERPPLREEDGYDDVCPLPRRPILATSSYLASARSASEPPLAATMAANAPAELPPQRSSSIPSRAGLVAERRAERHWERQSAGSFVGEEVACVLPFGLLPWDGQVPGASKAPKALADTVRGAFDTGSHGYGWVPPGWSGKTIAERHNLVTWIRR